MILILCSRSQLTHSRLPCLLTHFSFGMENNEKFFHPFFHVFFSCAFFTSRRVLADFSLVRISALVLFLSPPFSLLHHLLLLIRKNPRQPHRDQPDRALHSIFSLFSLSLVDFLVLGPLSWSLDESLKRQQFQFSFCCHLVFTSFFSSFLGSFPRGLVCTRPQQQVDTYTHRANDENEEWHLKFNFHFALSHQHFPAAEREELNAVVWFFSWINIIRAHTLDFLDTTCVRRRQQQQGAEKNNNFCDFSHPHTAAAHFIYDDNLYCVPDETSSSIQIHTHNMTCVVMRMRGEEACPRNSYETTQQQQKKFELNLALMDSRGKVHQPHTTATKKKLCFNPNRLAIIKKSKLRI